MTSFFSIPASQAAPPSVSPLTSQTERAAAVRDVLLEEGKKLIKEYEDTFFNQLFYGILFYEVDNMRYDR